MTLAELFPAWGKLTPAQQQAVTAAAALRTVPKGTLLYSGPADCLGFLLVRSGQLRVYILSGDGREVTLYRLLPRDLCLLSAACVLRGLQFPVAIEAEKDSELWVLPARQYQQLMEQSAPVANYTNEVLATRFADVMWLVEQILWQRFDKRLAAFLLQESALEGTAALRLTHEAIGRHLGSPREVVTRMLRYFQAEGLVELARGAVTLTDTARLQTLADG